MRKGIIIGTILTVIGLIALIIFVVCDNWDTNTQFDSENTVITSCIEYGEDTYEIYMETIGNKVYVVKNNELQKEVTTKSVLKPMISLPVVETAVKFDTESNESLKATHNTYKISLVRSIEHVNYLLENGYEKVFTAQTPEFYELYLENTAESNNKLKRIIITTEFMTEFNADDINFNIDNYID